ncbi:MAG: NACHT domain-containing protein, partial [Cyanobacteriota bacterium]|nr:NACHT domain-containing protein [Cyanobacteriota bacterium]
MGAGALEGQELERFRRAYGDQSPRPILEVVVEASLRKLVVLGDPGSGNSLLLQALVLGWAECAAPNAQQSLPVSIELREYARWLEQGQVKGFVEFLARAEGLGAHFEREALQKWLRHRPSRVLFDGLDEVF